MNYPKILAVWLYYTVMCPKDADRLGNSRICVFVKILKIPTPKTFAVIALKFEQDSFTVEYCIQKMQTESQTV